MGKTTVVYVTFPSDVACHKLLNSANVSRSYSQNNTGTVFLRHGVFVAESVNFEITFQCLNVKFLIIYWIKMVVGTEDVQ